jgi:hypothetical protein
MDQIVVAAATGERPQFAAAVEGLEDHARVIGEPTHDPEIHFHEIREAPNFQSGQDLIQFRAASLAVENLEGRFCQRAELRGRLLPRLALALVDDLQNLLPLLFGHILGAKEIDPKFPVAHPDHEIARAKTKRAQKIDAERNRFHICAEGFFADDIGVELEMLAQPAALLLLVTKTLRDRKPLERFFEFAVMRGDDARQRRCKLGAHCHFAVAFIGKIKKLADNFGSAFFCVERGRLQHRTIPFHKAVAPRDFAPALEDVIAHSAIDWKEVAEAGKRLHWI